MCLNISLITSSRFDLKSIVAFAATSFGHSSLQHLAPLVKALPDQLNLAFPSVLSLIPG